MELVIHVGLAVAFLWLLHKARSATALACTGLGIGLLLAMRTAWLRPRLGKVGSYGIAVVLAAILLHWKFNLGGVVAGWLGRDLTLTGRTEIWQAVLNEKTDPLFGVGFYCFWLGDRMEKLSHDYYFHLNQAHNAYIETYLNSGWIGLILLAAALLSGVGRIKSQAAGGDDHGCFRLAFLLAAAVYGLTEAYFDRLGPVWFVLLLVLMEYPSPKRREQRAVEAVGATDGQGAPGRAGLTVDALPS
jgi:O-antigen ligase